MKFIQALIALFLASFSTVAMAAGTAADAQQPNAFGPLIFLVILVALMYLLVWRPQQKRAKAQRDLLAGVQKGDEVMTQGGLLGKVVEVYDNHFALQLAENMQVTIQRSAVASSLPKGTIKTVTGGAAN